MLPYGGSNFRGRSGNEFETNRSREKNAITKQTNRKPRAYLNQVRIVFYKVNNDACGGDGEPLFCDPSLSEPYDDDLLPSYSPHPASFAAEAHCPPSPLSVWIDPRTPRLLLLRSYRVHPSSSNELLHTPAPL